MKNRTPLQDLLKPCGMQGISRTLHRTRAFGYNTQPTLTTAVCPPLRDLSYSWVKKRGCTQESSLLDFGCYSGVFKCP